MANATEATTGADPARSRTGNLVYDAVFAGAVGGSAIALFFLIVDAAGGRPLSTPSTIGTMVFTGSPPAADQPVRLDMVSYFTLIHFVMFVALGAGAALIRRSRAFVDRPDWHLAAVIFGIMSISSLGFGVVLVPGLAAAVGIARILVANLVTAVTMTAFLRWAHADGTQGAEVA